MKGGQVIWIWMKWTRQSDKMVGNRHMISNDSDLVYWILALTSWKAWKRPNLPSQFNPSPIYPGLQVQLYEPWVLVQEALWWQTFILHSSMFGRQKNIHSSEWEITGNLSNEYCESEKNSHLRHFKCWQRLIPFSQRSPSYPGGHKHRYPLSVNPDWQVASFSQWELLSQVFWRRKNK